jgi:FkbM family methyltransferase
MLQVLVLCGNAAMGKHYLRLWRYWLKILTGTFVSPEPEFSHLQEWLSPGDWAIDIGANVGHYTLAMARLTGPDGHVFAFEPFPETFSVLTANLRSAGLSNVSLVNAAASDRSGTAQLHYSGNHYAVNVSDTGELSCLCLPLDALGLNGRIRLVKIDVEGHEAAVIRGAEQTLRRHRPIVIMEGSRAAAPLLLALGYRIIPQLEGRRSPNSVFQP